MKTALLIISVLILVNTSYSQNVKKELKTESKDTILTDSINNKIITNDKWTSKRQNRYRHETNIGLGKTKFKITETKDTTVIGFGLSELLIVENGNNTNVKWRGNHYNRKYRKRNKFIGHWSGFEIGINDLIGDKNGLMELSFPKSQTVNINFAQYCINLAPKNKNIGIITGLGINWYNFRFKKNYSLHENKDGLTERFKVNPDWDVKKSKLAITYLTVPLLIELQSRNNRFYIATGVIGGLKINSHTKVKYDGSSKDKDHKDFNIRPYKLDATVRLGIGFIKLFSTYSLFTLYEKDKAVDSNGEFANVTPYTIGFTFSFR